MRSGGWGKLDFFGCVCDPDKHAAAMTPQCCSKAVVRGGSLTYNSQSGLDMAEHPSVHACAYVGVSPSVRLLIHFSCSGSRTLNLPEHFIFTSRFRAGPKVLSHCMVSMETGLFTVISFRGRGYV